MARGKKIEFTLKKVFIEFHCSKCDKDFKVEVNDMGDFYFGVFPCELCGSHGEFMIDLECPGCGNTREIEIRSW